jgi:hypothetical protein
MEDRQKLTKILRAELTFLEDGGYRRHPHYPWRPNFVFEDSPTCINYRGKQERRPCHECPLMEFVPADRRDTPFPCRHIRLNDRGDTVNSFYEWGTDEEFETALDGWLSETIRELETGEQSLAQSA